MNDVQHARNLIHEAEALMKIAKEALDKAQEPKIALEPLGVYELENGEIKFALRSLNEGFFVEIFGSSDSHHKYNKDGTSFYHGDGRPPVKKHVGKIAIVPSGCCFNSYAANPLTFNTK